MNIEELKNLIAKPYNLENVKRNWLVCPQG